MTRTPILTFLLLAMIDPLGAANAPCCYVTALDSRTGLVTAKENSSGRAFQFMSTDIKQIRELRVGSPVFANFGASKVSLDGHVFRCNILNNLITPEKTSKPVPPAASTRPHG